MIKSLAKQIPIPLQEILIDDGKVCWSAVIDKDAAHRLEIMLRKQRLTREQFLSMSIVAFENLQKRNK